MTAKETLKYWREKLSCEEQVKMQLAQEYLNANSKKEINFLNDIYKLIYKDNGKRTSNRI